MMMQKKPDSLPPQTGTTNVDGTDSEQYHGDLRKGAYLQRRAAYQMQASAAPSRQAGAGTGRNSGKV